MRERRVTVVAGPCPTQETGEKQVGVAPRNPDTRPGLAGRESFRHVCREPGFHLNGERDLSSEDFLKQIRS